MHNMINPEYPIVRTSIKSYRYSSSEIVDHIDPDDCVEWDGLIIDHQWF